MELKEELIQSLIAHDDLEVYEIKNRSFSSSGKINGFFLSNESISQLLHTVGVPLSIYKKLPEKLSDELINFLIEDNKIFDEYNALVKDGTVISFVKKGIPLIKGRQVYESIKEILSNDFTIDFVYSSIDKVDLSFFTPKVQVEVPKKGDIVQGGARIVYSPRGLQEPSIEGYMFTLQCTNGMVVKTLIEKMPVAIKEIPSDFIPELICNAIERVLESIEGKINEFVEMRSIKIDDPGKYVDFVMEKAKIPMRYRNKVLLKLTEEQSRISDLYDMINLVTNVANSSRSEGRRALQSVAWTFVQNYTICEMCHRPLNI